MKPYKLRKPLLMLMDAVLVVTATLFSVYLAGYRTSDLVPFIFAYLAIEILLVIVSSSIVHLYRSLLKYVTIIDLIKIVMVDGFISSFTLIFVLISSQRFVGIRFSIINGALLLLFLGLSRFLIRILLAVKNRDQIANKGDNVMIIGAGDAGNMIVKEMLQSNKITKVPVCIIDDDITKKGGSISNIPIVGNRYDIVDAVKKYDIQEIILAMPASTNKERAEILKICSETSCKVRTLPGMYELVNDTASISKVRDVESKDLLGRAEVKVNLDEIMGYIENRTILVTGGGGSIGSELCRQIAMHNPKRLIILDIYENNAYDIEQELKRKYNYLNLTVLIASIRDKGRLEEIFKEYKIDIVFNAAAHKHVPLMETSPNEAVKNNVFGTLNLARLADQYNCLKFIQISTDKAVNPTNIMGATKRICEMIIQAIGTHSKCDFVAVRFGNVLGSNGSVIPLFKKQIAEGGPVTVTHKDITRYFMTIPEAVSLVLQAGAYAKGGQIFVLDMGEPVKIYDLAYSLIKLSGYIPNEDIKIKITGLRPGEKLYEERLMSEEGLEKTANGLISIAKRLEFNEDEFFNNLTNLYQEAYNESDNIKELVARIVPTYTPR